MLKRLNENLRNENIIRICNISKWCQPFFIITSRYDLDQILIENTAHKALNADSNFIKLFEMDIPLFTGLDQYVQMNMFLFQFDGDTKLS